MNDKIWFIPYMANKVIYFDKGTCKCYVCEIESEYENAESWSRADPVKYRLECVFRERYIFLYSYKNERYLEIDTLTGNTSEVDIFLKKEDYFRYMHKMGKIIDEFDAMDILDLSQISSINEKKNQSDIGEKIFYRIMLESK